MSYLKEQKIPEGHMAFQTEFDDNLEVVETAIYGVMAGDVISFNYAGSNRIGFIVKSRRSDFNGTFVSTRGNTLLNVFLLDSISNSNCRLMINTLYKDRIRSTYVKTPNILGAFLGVKNFRTFNVSLISDVKLYIININIIKEELENEEDPEELEDPNKDKFL